MEEIVNNPLEPVTVVDIQFRPGQKIYFFDPGDAVYETGDHVIMDTARGAEFGICAGGNHQIPARDVVTPLRPVLRKATKADEAVVEENRKKEKRAFEICVQKIAEQNLDMQLVSVECAFDNSKLLFFFTADERVDFRELVKSLAAIFHTRIELRQIGVRDKAKMIGGLGICGRPFCCASFLDDFQPVSIKMAKTQSLSLNPAKISGTCGRLMCCLKYEQDTYEELMRMSPKLDSLVDTPEGRGTVTEVVLLQEKVKVALEKDPENPQSFKIADIAVLRNGKGAKNEEPIPANYAPVSGRKRVEKREEETAPVLEAIKFRYSTESVAEEKVITEEPKKARPERKRRPPKPQKEEREAPKVPEKKERPKAEKQDKPPKVEPKPETAEEKGEDKKRRPHHRRFHKPKPKAE